ncbi:MAG: hypothetical protein ACHQIG_04960 [Acidimicrobiia bacterium]
MNRPPAQPAMPTRRYRTRPNFAIRAATRGMALVRGLLLVGVTGFLIAAVVATIFAGLVIAINGKLP